MKTAITSLFLLGFIALGLALAFNVRGITSEHAKRSIASARPIRVLLRRDLTPEAMQRRIVMQTVLERIIGAAFALAGLAMLIAMIAGA